MPCATWSRVSKPYQFTPEIRNGWLDGLRICVPLVRHPPAVPGTGVEVGAAVGVGPIGVLVGGLPAAMTVVEGIFSKVSTIMPMTIMLKILDLRIMIFSPYLHKEELSSTA